VSLPVKELWVVWLSIHWAVRQVFLWQCMWVLPGQLLLVHSGCMLLPSLRRMLQSDL
jgi:hypothetical protein